MEPRSPRAIFALALSVLIAGCSASPAQHADDPGAGADASPSDDAAATSDSLESKEASTSLDAADAIDPKSKYVVIEKDAPGADWKCTTPDDCVDDYRRFMVLAKAHAKPIAQSALDAQLFSIALGTVSVPKTTLSESALRDAIVDGLDIRFLVEGIEARPLTVTTTATSSTADYDERDLLFDDPWVGRFKGILLTPKGSARVPALVAIHGHPDDAKIYRDDFHGKEWPSHGYAILMLTMRAMAIDWNEHAISQDMLLDGFALMGMRVYETMLGLKYLRHLARVDETRLGLIGHSGGSSAGNLTVRIETTLRAFVSDNQVDWYSSSPTELYHCETVPALYPHNERIDDFSTSKVPIKAVRYGYVDGMKEIFDFFDDRTK